MLSQSFKGRRRTTRNKTTVVEASDLQGGGGQKSGATDCGVFKEAMVQDVFRSFEGFSVQPKQQSKPDAIKSRTFAFAELISAFQTIEKRVFEDPWVVRTVLKRFKTNDELAVGDAIEDERVKMQTEIFPKIINNPFLRSDLEVPIDKIEEETRTSRFNHRRFK